MQLSSLIPIKLLNKADPYLEVLNLLIETKNPNVLVSLTPSIVRGLILDYGKNKSSELTTSYNAHFDWEYKHDNQAMQKLYSKAKALQWDSDELPWQTSVDPFDPNTVILPKDFLDLSAIKKYNLSDKQVKHLQVDLATWMLSQFLHGEQGALFVSAQVTQSVKFFDGKLYGSTQVVDEGRHVEVFHKYLTEKLNKSYKINDNLFVILDSLMTDSRWDMKFLGMQIMVEGLALGAFNMLHKATQEPLLKDLLKRVIQDEARHVHYGVLALKDYFHQLSAKERNEREDWAFEISLLMKNRFMAYEVYDEWFSGTMPRYEWRNIVSNSPGMKEFRQNMFARLMPNLREIGLVSNRTRQRYQQAGLLKYIHGDAASEKDY